MAVSVSELLNMPQAELDALFSSVPAGPIPKYLRPIFRDRDEFSAGHSLAEQSIAALTSSKSLVVLCSPNAARSFYVNEEIRSFKAMGRSARVLAVIVDGEPGDPERECFPPALRFKVDAQGKITDEREEPIAADARDQGDGKSMALQKTVAGLLGCGVMAGLGAAVNTANVGRDDTVAVIGCGGVGDAAIAGGIPKSASAASAQGKACAAAIAKLLAGQSPEMPRLTGACYNTVAPGYAFSLSGIYQPKGDLFAEAEVSTSPVDAPREARAQEAERALNWFRTITVECFG